MNSHAIVYRAYDAEGALLYVGCTTQPLKYRLGQHSKNSAWWPLHERIEHDTPRPVEIARRAESDQITLLRPRFNRNAGAPHVPIRVQPTEHEIRQWKARYEAGATVEEIALDAGICTTVARRYLVEAGTEMRRPGQRAGVPQLNCAKARSASSAPVLHVAFAGSRGVHRRRGRKAA